MNHRTLPTHESQSTLHASLSERTDTLSVSGVETAVALQASTKRRVRDQHTPCLTGSALVTLGSNAFLIQAMVRTGHARSL